MKKIPLDISVLSIPVSTQLKDLHIVLALDSLIKFDKLVSAMVTTFLHGLMPAKTFHRGVKRLKKEIRHEVAKQTS
ncbi:MAG: hypothetical protein ABIS50_15210 [Luteolibacter sp.]|uniref:hypothetical protein n=1 Tax=Luteolibacter sp. TaxID=1962973 RepID=UPI0032654767